MKHLIILACSLVLVAACKKADTNNTSQNNQQNNQPNTPNVPQPCPDGYTGAGCLTTYADRMVGQWDATYSAGGQSTKNIMKIEVLTQPKKAMIRHFFFVTDNVVYADFSSKDSFTLSGNPNYSGGGTITEDGKEIHGNFNGHGGDLILEAHKLF